MPKAAQREGLGPPQVWHARSLFAPDVIQKASTQSSAATHHSDRLKAFQELQGLARHLVTTALEVEAPAAK